VTTTGVWLLVGAVVVLLFLAWSLWTLTRLRRLSGRVDRAWAQLESQLQRRAGLADELAREHADALGSGDGAAAGGGSGGGPDPAVR
jgi:type VI protein secretion system component VasK